MLSLPFFMRSLFLTFGIKGSRASSQGRLPVGFLVPVPFVGRLFVRSFLSSPFGFVLPFVAVSLVRSCLGLVGALACLVAAWVNFVDLRLVPGLSVIQPRPPLRGPGQRQSTRDKRGACTLDPVRTELQGDGRAIPQRIARPRWACGAYRNCCCCHRHEWCRSRSCRCWW
jgi:hypothetical protein